MKPLSKTPLKPRFKPAAASLRWLFCLSCSLLTPAVLAQAPAQQPLPHSELRSEKPARLDKVDKADKADKGSERAIKAEKAEKPEKTDKNSKRRGPPSLGQSVFQILLGEVALQRRDLDLAANAYADLALRTRDPKVFERTIEIATHARRFDLAEEVAALWLEAEPKSQPARQYMVGALIMQQRMEAAAPHVTALLELEPGKLGENFLRLGKSFGQHQNKDAVYRLLAQVASAYPELPEAHYATAVAAMDAGDLQRAGSEIRRARSLRPHWDNAVLVEAALLARDGPLAVIELLDAYLAQYPGAREVRLHQARTLISARRYADARAHFAELAKENPDSPDIIYPLAVLSLQVNDVKVAEPLFERLLTMEFAQKDLVTYYLGQIAEERKDVAAALGFYARIVPGEQYVAAQTRMAGLLARQGNLPAGRATLQDAQHNQPADRLPLVLAEAQLLRDNGEAAAALVLLEAELEKTPEQPELLYDAALLAERQNQLETMERYLRRVIVLRPDSAHAYNALGYSLAERHLRLDEAHALISKAVSLAPEDPYIRDSLGWVLFRQGQLDAARSELEKAYATKADAEIAAHLGEVLWQLNRHDDARRLWQAALKQQPDNEVLQATMRRLDRSPGRE